MKRKSTNKSILRLVDPGKRAKKPKAKAKKPKKKDPRSFIPDDPKKIRAKIKSYEHLLKKEKMEHGDYSDGYGKRYLLGPLYLFYGDMDAALKHFDWFNSEFPDDTREPGHLLCWVLVLLRAGKKDAAKKILGQTMLFNTHIIPHLLGEIIIRACEPYPTADDWPNLVGMMPPEYFEIWTKEEKALVSEVYQSEFFTGIREQWLDYELKLEDEKPGPERTRLCDEKWALIDAFKEEQTIQSKKTRIEELDEWQQLRKQALKKDKHLKHTIDSPFTARCETCGKVHSFKSFLHYECLSKDEFQACECGHDYREDVKKRMKRLEKEWVKYAIANDERGYVKLWKKVHS